MTETQPRAATGTLYVVATPIGNLEDITYRAVRVLGEVALVAAEDTRHSRKLFARFGIGTPLVSCHDHNERQRLDELLARLEGGDDVALISDAGTPCIADPGYRLVSACRDAGIPVVPVPGPSAVVTALSAAGVSTERFAFEGYLPQRAKARADLLRLLSGEPRTLVFYEAPHRLPAALADLEEIFGGERELVVARELTKLHEEFYRGSISGARAHFGREAVRGELVLVVPAAANAGERPAPREALRRLLADGLPRREAVKLVAKEYGIPGSDLYRESLSLGDGDD